MWQGGFQSKRTLPEIDDLWFFYGSFHWSEALIKLKILLQKCTYILKELWILSFKFYIKILVMIIMNQTTLIYSIIQIQQFLIINEVHSVSSNCRLQGIFANLQIWTLARSFKWFINDSLCTIMLFLFSIYIFFLLVLLLPTFFKLIETMSCKGGPQLQPPQAPESMPLPSPPIAPTQTAPFTFTVVAIRSMIVTTRTVISTILIRPPPHHTIDEWARESAEAAGAPYLLDFHEFLFVVKVSLLKQEAGLLSWTVTSVVEAVGSVGSLQENLTKVRTGFQ